ncbi:hypothetical protein [Magnetococcus sp. PR-3]|uniref:hypothetical protein n=1 Tax=Magnetococcus sp. PR-3 TaxID=3120355 RepID=UPI002FCE347E
MLTTRKTYSESWHRIAKIKLALRPTVQVSKRQFRGEPWYLVQDPFSSQFFRLRPKAYAFIRDLTLKQTVEETWRTALERDPDGTPGQEEALQLLTQLNQANLLYFDSTADSDHLYERQAQYRARMLKGKIMGFLFMRLPLWDPDLFLNQLQPLIHALFSRMGALIWVLVMGLALNTAFVHQQALLAQAQGVLAPDNLILLYLTLAGVKTLHEMGHAMACKRFGGEVHTMGVILLLFTPMPYMDATDSWRFDNRWHRVLVGSAGMLVELFIAALATLLWASSAPGVIHSLAYNIMFIASVSTLIFNANPLLRFDGYFILSDLVDVPNLFAKARSYLIYLIERYILLLPNRENPSQNRRGAAGLFSYGVLSMIYRLIVFGGIILFVSDSYMLFGILMALFLFGTWIWGLLSKFVRYLWNGASLHGYRFRAFVILGLMLTVSSLALGTLPAPHELRLPGITQALDYTPVVSQSEGQLVAIHPTPGRHVDVGAPILRLENKDQALQLESAQGQWEQVTALEKRAGGVAQADLQPVLQRKAVLKAMIEHLQARHAALELTAPEQGRWLPAAELESLGNWVPRGMEVGRLLQSDRYRFTAVLNQEEASLLFAQTPTAITVRLHGREAQQLQTVNMQIIPYQREELPSAALGWLGGGDIAISMDDQAGLKSSEPFFLLQADLDPEQTHNIGHGHTGIMRLELIKEPLLSQWKRRLSQFLQRRYQL